MPRLTLLRNALSKAEALSVKFPQVKTIESIIHQLTYLIALESGETQDRSRLKDIILGVQAAREIEPLDMDLAETLYLVDDEAKAM